MMKCDTLDLVALLNSDEELANAHPADSQSAMAEIARHVETCHRCQDRLTNLAAEEGEWQEVRDCLSHDALLTDKSETSWTSRERWMKPRNWTQAMAQSLLAPPGHPEMLGRLGRYEIERLIGSGGMGIVFKAHDSELNRPVAIKVLAPYLAEIGSARQRFAREARAAAAVVDDHVVPIHNVETDHAEIPFLVMQYVAGGSLQQRLDREGPQDLTETLRIGMQTAKGLAAAHAQGLIHRDIKPSNILLDEGVERALLTDFGLARAEDDACLTRTGFHPGTPHYMSPEQVRGEAIDARSDLFGLGCVLYALCTGHPPFRADSSFAVLRRITDDAPRPIRENNPHVPGWFERIVMKLLAKSPVDRFHSSEEVAELLEECLAHVQQPTSVPLPKAAKIEPSRDLRRPIRSLASTSIYPSWFGNSNKRRRWISLRLVSCILLLATVFVVETNKGTLHIETNSQYDIPVRITQSGKTVKTLQVSSNGTRTRLKAGEYRVEIDETERLELSQELKVTNGRVTLNRGDEWIARIHWQDPDRDLDREPQVESSESVITKTDTDLLIYGDLGTRRPDSITPNDASGAAQATPLDQAVDDFNQAVTFPFLLAHDRPQAKLTVDEVVASIQWYLHGDDTAFDDHRDGLRQVTEQHELPHGWKLVGGAKYRYVKVRHPFIVSEFRIELKIDERTIFPIRRSHISPPKEFRLPARQMIRMRRSHISPRKESRLPTSQPTSANAIPLEAAIDGFNKSHHQVDGIEQPRLTVDEVLAAIVAWREKRHEAPVDNATFERFQEIARTHHLPADAKIEVIPHFINSSGTYSIWSIRIVLPLVAGQNAGTFSFSIRHQFVGVNLALASKIHWGKPSDNGIQAGFRLTPAQPTYRLGQVVDVEFFYRSIYDPQTVSLPNAFTYRSATLRTNSDPAVRDESWTQVDDGTVIDQQEHLIAGGIETRVNETPMMRRGQRLKFVASPDDGEQLEVGTKLVVSPDANFRLSFNVANPAGDRDAPTLTTGELQFIVSDDNKE